MSALFTRPAAAVFVEFTEGVAHIVSDERALDLPIEREASGALKQPSADSVRDALKLFAKHPGREQAFCLLPARGISIRRISLPANSREDIERLLPLQIDAQFPLSSEELAWGYSALTPQGASSMKDLLVAAAKKDSLQQYREIISSAGFEPLFVIAALTREGMCATRPPRFGLLEVGANNSELVTFDESGPATLRVIGMGAESASAESLFNTLRSNGAVEKIFVSGKGSAIWSARISPNTPAEPLPVATGQSTAITGLRTALQRGTEPLLIHTNREIARVKRAPAQWRWAAAVCLLLLISLGLRYVDPIIRRGRIQRTIAELEARRAKLPKIDREAGFLNFVHTNQPNYLEVITALGGSIQPGLKLDSLTISKRGELSFRGMIQGGQAATAIRSKMIESGFFGDVVIDEQTPGQNNQMTFRMTAQLLPASERRTPVKTTEKPSGPGKSPNSIMPSPEMTGPPPGMVTEGGPSPQMMSAPQPGAVPRRTARPASVPPPTENPQGTVTLPPGVSLPPGVTIEPGAAVPVEGAPQ